MTALILLLAACISSCDYPEQGFFALVGIDGEGERVAYLPFMVDELTDDSHMTIGFTILLPRYGELVEIPLQNGEDVSRRYWLLEMAAADTGAGNLSVELNHSEERLMLSGLYQTGQAAEVQSVDGFMLPLTAGVSQLVYSVEKPAYPDSLSDVLFFEIHPVERADFEEFLGTAVDKARRVAAAPVPDLTPAMAPTDDTPRPNPRPAPPRSGNSDDEPPKPPPVLGGRR